MHEKLSVVSLPLPTVDWLEDYAGTERTVTKALGLDKLNKVLIPPRGLRNNPAIIPAEGDLKMIVGPNMAFQ